MAVFSNQSLVTKELSQVLDPYILPRLLQQVVTIFTLHWA